MRMAPCWIPWECGIRYLASLGVTARPGLRQILFPLSLSQCAAYLRESYGLSLSVDAIEVGINGSIRSFYCEQVVCKTGAKEFLQALRERGIPAVLATATDRAVMMEGLRRTGLLPLLDAVYTCGELGVDKRTPALFHHARAQMGTAIEATWVFEDAVFGLKSSGVAGFKRVGIYDPHGRMKRDDVRANCDIFIDSYEELDLARVLSFEG